MADIRIDEMTLLTSVDRAADMFEVADASDSNNSKRTSVNYALDLASHPVGVDDVQTLTNKTITDPTVSSPVLSGTLTGTYTLGGTPTFPSSVVTLTGSQTLTNKVLTSPTINAPTITNPTLTTDTVNEYTSAAGVTIDGLLIKDSKLATNNSVVTANITDDAVTAAKIDWATTGASGGIWWEELGRTTLGSTGDTISVTNIGARKYLRILVSVFGTGGTISTGIRFNNDTGSNYGSRDSSGSTTTSQTQILIVGAATVPTLYYDGTLLNPTSLEKTMSGIRQTSETAGAGTAPGLLTIVGKWANTAAQITRVDIVNTAGTGDFAIGSEVIVLGHN